MQSYWLLIITFNLKIPASSVFYLPEVFQLFSKCNVPIIIVCPEINRLYILQSKYKNWNYYNKNSRFWGDKANYCYCVFFELTTTQVNLKLVYKNVVLTLKTRCSKYAFFNTSTAHFLYPGIVTHLISMAIATGICFGSYYCKYQKSIVFFNQKITLCLNTARLPELLPTDLQRPIPDNWRANRKQSWTGKVAISRRTLRRCMWRWSH